MPWNRSLTVTTNAIKCRAWSCGTEAAARSQDHVGTAAMTVIELAIKIRINRFRFE